MRKLVAAVLAALVVALVLGSTANAGSSSTTTTSSKLSLTARITSFHATAAGAVVADGVLSGRLRTGGRVSRANAPVKFAVAARSHGRRCNVITLRLAPLDLQLLGVQVTTSYISLDVYGKKGRILGNLFCALAHAKVTFPHAARVARAMNAHVTRRALRVFSTSASVPARTAATTTPSCQVLKLVLGPLHLDLLGLVVDLYGRTHRNPVIVTINANPSQGLLGQLLCGIAGGGGITTIPQLQSLLSTLGDSLTTTQIQNLLSQLGINLSGGLSQTDLARILQSLGLGSSTPA